MELLSIQCLQYVSLVAGQEAGSKKEQLSYASCGKYNGNNVMMLGDAPGDLEAAIENQALFYPIKPGDEASSWKRFYTEALERFMSGNYSGEYMNQLVNEFLQSLPEESTFK
jgi:phosphoglycolate phosphatase-like HAD superfamily hydrolase